MKSLVPWTSSGDVEVPCQWCLAGGMWEDEEDAVANEREMVDGMERRVVAERSMMVVVVECVVLEWCAGVVALKSKHWTIKLSVTSRGQLFKRLASRLLAPSRLPGVAHVRVRP